MNNLFYRLLIILFVSSCQKYAEPEIFLIPESLVGTVLIIHEVPDGIKKYDENKNRIYEITNDGILYSGLDRVKGILNQKFFLVNDDRNRIEEIFYYKNFDKPEKQLNKKYILGQYDGTISLNPIKNDTGTEYNDFKSDQLKFQYTIIGSLENKDSIIESGHEFARKKIMEFKNEYL